MSNAIEGFYTGFYSILVRLKAGMVTSRVLHHPKVSIPYWFD